MNERNIPNHIKVKTQVIAVPDLSKFRRSFVTALTAASISATRTITSGKNSSSNGGNWTLTQGRLSIEAFCNAT